MLRKKVRKNVFDMTTTLERNELLTILDTDEGEAESLLREARIPAERERLTSPDLLRLEAAIERFCHRLVGRDWRRADGADRETVAPTELGRFDLFHRKSQQHKSLETFGQLLRWAETEYGWKA